jgi:hypothetical protein
MRCNFPRPRHILISRSPASVSSASMAKPQPRDDGERLLVDDEEGEGEVGGDAGRDDEQAVQDGAVAKEVRVVGRKPGPRVIVGEVVANSPHTYALPCSSTTIQALSPSMRCSTPTRCSTQTSTAAGHRSTRSPRRAQRCSAGTQMKWSTHRRCARASTRRTRSRRPTAEARRPPPPPGARLPTRLGFVQHRHREGGSHHHAHQVFENGPQPRHLLCPQPPHGLHPGWAQLRRLRLQPLHAPGHPCCRRRPLQPRPDAVHREAEVGAL